MNPISSFDPITIPSGVIKTNGINRGEQIVLFNSSLACLQLTFSDKTVDVLPPCWARSWEKDSPISNISYTTLFTVPVSGQPVSLLYGTLYEPGEHVAHVNQALQYVYVVGNPGGVGVSNVNELLNNGNAPLTPIINVNASDTGGVQTWAADNSGNLTIKGDNAGVLTTLFQIIAGVSPKINIGAATILTEIKGLFKVDGTSSLDNAIIVTDGNGRFIINDVVSTGQTFESKCLVDTDIGVLIVGHSATQSARLLDCRNYLSVTQFNVDNSGNVNANGSITANNGFTMTGGTFHFVSGGITRVSAFAGTGSGTYNHTMSGATPVWVQPIVNQVGSATQGFDSANSTQVHITLGSSLNFNALCWQ